MSYATYQTWLKGLSDKDLNKELVQVRKNVNGASSEKAYSAWHKMYEMVLGEQQRRDHVEEK